MSFSRGSLVFRQISNKIYPIKNSTLINNVSKRNHSYNYRIGTDKHPKKVIFLANAVGGLAWFWMLYHIFTEPEHLTGEFPYPVPSEWTDEELGIPDDEEGL